MVSLGVVRAQQEAWGNPSSLHNTGVKAAEFLERLRWKIADRFAVAPDQLIFTSGATESVHLAILGSATTLPRVGLCCLGWNIRLFWPLRIN